MRNYGINHEKVWVALPTEVYHAQFDDDIMYVGVPERVVSFIEENA